MENDLLPVIGMSPGNSYFKDDAVRFLLREAVGRHGRTAVLIPDVPAVSTYLGLGYAPAKARSKAILKGNNLKNRTRRIMAELGLGADAVCIIEWDRDVALSEAFTSAYTETKKLYGKNDAFRAAVDSTTRSVLENTDDGSVHDEQGVRTATQYLLSELAFMESAPALLGCTSALYVYHKPWPVYEDYVAGVFDNRRRQHLGFWLLRNT